MEVFVRTDSKPPLHPKEQMRGEIEQQIKAFFASGKKVYEAKYGETALKDGPIPFVIPKREIV